MEISEDLRTFIEGIPKAELHIHIEGTFEPELMQKIANRNGLPFEGTPETHRERRRQFKDLQDFLDLYYAACAVLKTEEDFRDLMYSYLQRASRDNVKVAEIFFDPQSHTENGISFETVIEGLHRGIVEGRRDFGVHGSLIMCFLRHLSEEKAEETLRQSEPFLDKIIGVGLDSGERGNPPSKFRRVYCRAKEMGLRLVAHAGEECGPDYITDALDSLHVSRIDHGVRCRESPELVRRLAETGIPLTVCPLSNDKLQVKGRFLEGKNPVKCFLDDGLMVTLNSDDPAYFGGYITDNFIVTARETGLTKADVRNICANAFKSTFLPEQDKERYLRAIEEFNTAHQ